MSPRLFVRAAAVLALCCAASSARAALSLVLEQSTPGPVAGGSVVPVNVVLRGTRTATIALVQFALGAPTNGSSFSTAVVTDGFDESPLTGLLSNAIDGSLLNNPTLAFATQFGSSDAGIVPGSGDVRVGTFYLQTPSGGGSFPLSFTSVEVTDVDFNPIAVTPSGLTVTAMVPEPASAVLTVCALAVLVRPSRRGRSARRIAAFA